ncbi:MAG: hypothetical protein MZW92_03745 [Comamonadaceae bacterium]|nr:hypothetical protein [Comamonadaceae bacterium]
MSALHRHRRHGAAPGWTTLPLSVNVWRCFMMLVGGLGIIVLAVAILPLLGVGGTQLFKAETAGPMKDQKLTPRIAETARGLWAVYVLLSRGLHAGLPRRRHELGRRLHAHVQRRSSLGGFSSHDASLGYFDSVTLEIIVMVFALIAGISFSTHFMAFRMRRLLVYRFDVEIRGSSVCSRRASSALTFYLLYKEFYLDFPEALRFGFVSHDLGCTHARVFHHRLQRLAVFRASVDAVSVEFRRQLRL